VKKAVRLIAFDRSAETLKNLANCLVQRGYEVIQCFTPEETMRAAKEHPANIVLLDVGVNEIAGTRIIRNAKANNPEISVILLGTREEIDSNPNMVMFAGYEYVLKPLNADALCSVIEQRLNQQHMYRVCSALSVTLDPKEVLNLLLETALHEVGADQAAILLLDDDLKTIRLEAARGFSNGCTGAVCEMDETSILTLVLANNEPIVLQGGLAQLPFIPRDIARVIRSSICAPIRIGGKTIGILNVNRLNHAAPFSQSDLRAIEIVALQTAVAIQNVRIHLRALEQQRLRHELDLAQAIQKSLFPKISGYEHLAEIVAKNVPAHMIGGDFFDFVELGPHRFGLIIADVAGKGVPGALLMVRAISNFRLRARPHREPSEVLNELNDTLIEGSTHGMYVTAVYAVFDLTLRRLRFANAGHPPFLLRREETLTSPDSLTGVPLGILKGFEYRTDEVPLHTGDLAVFYTDGITEARSLDKEYYSLERLKYALSSGPDSAQAVADHILNDLADFTANRPQHDDLTLVTAKINGFSPS
jgi:sigma-B regulation protein RsbU (phosphoserine phosphatase)